MIISPIHDVIHQNSKCLYIFRSNLSDRHHLFGLYDNDIGGGCHHLIEIACAALIPNISFFINLLPAKQCNVRFQRRINK